MAFGFRKSEPEFSNDPAVTLPIYLKFVQKHLARGGKVDYSASKFASAELEYQRGGSIRVDETRRTVLAGKGTKIERPDLGNIPYQPGGYDDDEPRPRQPNTTVYQMDGYKTVGGELPTVYADVEFDAILNGQHEQERRDELWQYVADGYGDLVPSRLGGTGPDTYALPQNDPHAAQAPPTAEQLKQDEIVLAALSEAAEVKGEVTLPSGRTVDPDAMRAFQTAFGDSGAPVSPTAGTADQQAAPTASAAQQKSTGKPGRGLEQS
ncbi:hypothetical protein GCM10029976_070990 [Kribbella albertanoniae]|uniref:Uncharacterized protein n=1 Tax=Kribbella albertanoniae TaxID=1266829 RepID=A0A4R4PNU2_9ACTN|nr:hypothetical protein [Kribbella albertanoniae]TDC23877.1 hypothetical protein E1261_27495 [Kribbella albertanoniae]